MFDGMIKVAQETNKRMPFLVAIRGSSENLQTERARLKMTEQYKDAGIPVYRSMERACRAMYRVTGYYRMVEEGKAEKAKARRGRSRRRTK